MNASFITLLYIFIILYSLEGPGDKREYIPREFAIANLEKLPGDAKIGMHALEVLPRHRTPSTYPITLIARTADPLWT
jgi:hypothetical protein